MSACSTNLVSCTWFDYTGYRDYKQLWEWVRSPCQILIRFNVGAAPGLFGGTVASEIIHRLHRFLARRNQKAGGFKLHRRSLACNC